MLICKSWSINDFIRFYQILSYVQSETVSHYHHDQMAYNLPPILRMLPFMFAPIAFLAIFGSFFAQMAGVFVPVYAMMLGLNEVVKNGRGSIDLLRYPLGND